MCRSIYFELETKSDPIGGYIANRNMYIYHILYDTSVDQPPTYLKLVKLEMGDGGWSCQGAKINELQKIWPFSQAK